MQFCRKYRRNAQKGDYNFRDIFFLENIKKDERKAPKIIGTFDERYNQMLDYFALKKNQFKRNNKKFNVSIR